MVETSLGISQSMRLSGVDYYDLDGSLMIENEPFGLLKEEDGTLDGNKLKNLGDECENRLRCKRVFHNWRGLGNYSRDLLVGLKNYFPGEEYVLFSMDYQDEALRFEQNEPEFSIIKPLLFSKIFPSLWRTNLSKEFDDQKLDIFHGISHEL